MEFGTIFAENCGPYWWRGCCTWQIRVSVCCLLMFNFGKVGSVKQQLSMYDVTYVVYRCLSLYLELEAKLENNNDERRIILERCVFFCWLKFKFHYADFATKFTDFGADTNHESPWTLLSMKFADFYFLCLDFVVDFSHVLSQTLSQPSHVGLKVWNSPRYPRCDILCLQLSKLRKWSTSWIQWKLV